MRRDQLEHAIRAACDVSEDDELIVFGSQAILGQFPEAPPEVTASIEVDVQPRNRPEAVDAIDGALASCLPSIRLTGSTCTASPSSRRYFRMGGRRERIG